MTLFTKLHFNFGNNMTNFFFSLFWILLSKGYVY